MACNGNTASSTHEAATAVMLRLYKFSIVLTANEQLARALMRGTLRSSGGRLEKRVQDRSDGMGVMRQMYALWMSKLAEDATVQQKNAPEMRLFANLPVHGTMTGNSHFSKFITTMPSTQRATLYLIYGEGFSYDEATEIFGLNVLALMKIIARGHLALANWLDHRGFTETPAAAGHNLMRLGEKAA